MFRKLLPVLCLISFMLSGGCSGIASRDKRDPIEGLNRAIYKFNDGFDRILFQPAAKGYKAIVPDPAEKGVSNFFGNIEDVTTAANQFLQFKFHNGTSDASRVLINSTIGLLGLLDIASSAGLDKHNEDFGQTLGHWGVGPGPYIMLPLYGPSTLRDLVSTLVDAGAFDPTYSIDHLKTRTSLFAIETVDKRADLLGASNALEQAAIDRYDFLKESYLQQLEYAVNDGELGFPE